MKKAVKVVGYALMGLPPAAILAVNLAVNPIVTGLLLVGCAAVAGVLVWAPWIRPWERFVRSPGDCEKENPPRKIT